MHVRGIKKVHNFLPICRCTVETEQDIATVTIDCMFSINL